jgi:FAD-dependent oxidoreductase family protein
MTSYSAARQGLHVILLEPGAHLGGMVTGGLSATDLGHFTIIGGYARDFYMQAAAHYGVHDLDKADNWRSEPHVGEEIFRKMLTDAGVTVRYHEKLREHAAVESSGATIRSITTEDGKKWSAKIFADCSYEGDLMAQAGITYTWGRESAAQYDEDLAGVRANTPAHQFRWRISAFDEQHHLLPEILPGPLAPPGSADKDVQSYNLRLILTRDPANSLPFTKPDRYDPARFALLARYLSEFEARMGHAPTLGDITNPVPIPNQKADFNNNGPFSTDFIGHSWNYPNGSYAEKTAIWKETLLYTQSFFYFISHDPSVRQSLRDETNSWGLSKDEFLDTDHWPNQLYIREGRRMIGEYVMRQDDLQRNRTKSDSIGMGSYNSDSHNVERVAMPDGSVQNEGDVQVPVQPYEIEYRIITPKRAEATNLLVPVCFSASHVAYSSLRMEPQYMIIGQAAGVAAWLAIRDRKPVQDISIDALQKNLRAHGAILNLAEEFHPADKGTGTPGSSSR